MQAHRHTNATNASNQATASSVTQQSSSTRVARHSTTQQQQQQQQQQHVPSPGAKYSATVSSATSSTDAASQCRVASRPPSPLRFSILPTPSKKSEPRMNCWASRNSISRHLPVAATTTFRAVVSVSVALLMALSALGWLSCPVLNHAIIAGSNSWYVVVRYDDDDDDDDDTDDDDHEIMMTSLLT
eukprot:COSAG06_NODE_3289_length_5550_cov_26.579894_5_plen_186_part_00